MTLADIAHIGELLGGAGVLGSLIFVGLQIKQNTKSVRASTLQLNTDYWANFLTTMADPQYVTVFGKGMAGNADVDQNEFGQFFVLTRAYFLGLENQHFQYRQGLLDTGQFASYEIATREQMLAFPGIRAVWKMVRHTYSKEFIDFVDQLIAATPLHRESAFGKWKALVAAERATAPTQHQM